MASFSGLIQVSNEVCPLSLLLEASKHHLCARDVLLGVLKVHPQCVLSPCDAFVLVGVGVPKACCLACLTSNKPVQVGSCLVLASSLYCVTLSTLLYEDLLSLLSISIGDVSHCE